MFPYSPSAKTNQQKRLMKQVHVQLYNVFTIVTQFNFNLGHKLSELLNEVEYDVKDYPD